MKRIASKNKLMNAKPTKKVKTVQTKLFGTTDTFVLEPKALEPQAFGNRLRLFHWNVDSLNAKMQRPPFLNYLASADFDLICFNETKFSLERFLKLEVQKNELWAGRYHQYWNFSSRKLGYSGVAVLSRQKPLSHKFGLGEAGDFDLEGRAVTLEFPAFFIVAVYAPNSGAGCKRLAERTQVWEAAVLGHLERLRAIKGVMLIGDLNVAPQPIDLTHPDRNHLSSGFTKEERACFGRLLERGFVDAYRHKYPGVVKYTWWSQRQVQARPNNVGWRIDHAVVDEKALAMIEDVVVRDDVFGSDHCPLEVVMRLDLAGSGQIGDSVENGLKIKNENDSKIKNENGSEIENENGSKIKNESDLKIENGLENENGNDSKSKNGNENGKEIDEEKD